MAQEFVVLECCQCHTYQVHQSKKATKWLCKMCGHKQSFKQFFGRGSAKECRLAVQTLNRQQFSGDTIEGVVIHVNNSSNTTADDIDSRILDQILATEDNYDSSDGLFIGFILYSISVLFWIKYFVLKLFLSFDIFFPHFLTSSDLSIN